MKVKVDFTVFEDFNPKTTAIYIKISARFTKIIGDLEHRFNIFNAESYIIVQVVLDFYFFPIKAKSSVQNHVIF